MRIIVLLCLWLLLTSGYASENDPGTSNAPIAVSDVKDDETLVFFQTSAWLDQDTLEWHLPVHGWIYEPQDSTIRKALARTVLERQFGLEVSDTNEANFSRRLNLLFADNERGKEIVINLAGQDHVLAVSAKNGHIQDTVVIPSEKLDHFGKNGFIEYSAAAPDSRSFHGQIRLVDPCGLSVISDIDDTVKISEVTDRTRLLEHAFLLDFTAAPGMSSLYERWYRQGASFHFVSSSPWQLYAPLREFLDASGFPWATFNLKAVRFRDETLFDLFRKGTETKPAIIESILQRYPERQFVLVGDSGEQDPEVYAALMHRFPDQVKRVYIRNVTGETADSERFATLFDGIDPGRWALFDDPAALELPAVNDQHP